MIYVELSHIMSKAEELGKELRDLRKQRGESLVHVAEAVRVDRSHLNKVELGEYMPSDEMLRNLVSYFSLPESTANRLLDLGGIKSRVVIVRRDTEREGTNMDKEDKKEVTSPKPGINLTIDPLKKPVYYTDSAFVHATNNGLTLDFAQTMGGSTSQCVVTRVGMSYDHAKELVKAINEQLEKNER